MKRLFLLTIIASLLILGGCATVQAQSQQTTPAGGKTYVLPAKITLMNEVIRETAGAEELQLLEGLANKNECVKVIKTPDGNKIYLVYCGTPQEPYCLPALPGRPKICY